MGFFREKTKGFWLEAFMAILLLGSAWVLFSGDVVETTSRSVKEEETYYVILDAGHGGNDPGKIGVDGTQEKDLNLIIAGKVKRLLEQQGVKVLMTRESDTGLYDETASNKKVQDMKRRCNLVNEEKPSCVVSIHQNSYHEESVSGPQVFFYSTSKEGKELAEVLQEELIRVLKPGKERQVKANDSYYLLKKTEAPICIVECGFLSNWEESRLLQDENYQERLAWAIHMGIMRYLNQT
jgi:N-acetylmuramoyl-L-alanine amidase